jgi:hypothetical protein
MKVGVTDVKSYTPAYSIGVVRALVDYFCGGNDSINKKLKDGSEQRNDGAL